MSAERSLQATYITDDSGNPVGIVLDGSVYRLQSIGKVLNVAGAQINPATQETLSDADTKLGTIDGVLDSIKDTDGIKKITDALPVGDNWIGRIKVGDGTNVVGIVLDGALYRLQSDSKVAKDSTGLVHLETLDVSAGKGRLKSTLYSPDGEAIAFSSVSDNPESIKNEFVKNGSNESLLVDGSSTPVEFTYLADSSHDISLQEIKFVLAANGITFGTGYLGATSGPLTNGIKIEIIAGGNTGTVAILKRNECFVHFASPGGFNWVVSSKDMLSSTYVIGGALKLGAGTSDKVKITVQDDIDNAGVYFQCLVKGNILAA